MERNLWSAEIAGIRPVEGVAPDNVFYIRLDCQVPADTQIYGNRLISCMHENAIFIEYDRITSSDLNVIRHISAGLQRIIYAANAVACPIAHIFESPPIMFAIWCDREIPPVGDMVIPTSLEVRDTAMRLADILRARDQYVEGFTRANTLLTGLLTSEDTAGKEPARIQRFITSGFETDVISLPRPL